jgi:hypothetical protein
MLAEREGEEPQSPVRSDIRQLPAATAWNV